MKVLWAMHLELHMLQWVYEFIFISHIPLLQSFWHMTFAPVGSLLQRFNTCPNVEDPALKLHQNMRSSSKITFIFDLN